jgi:electron transfer flavoprotein alpha subunit
MTKQSVWTLAELDHKGQLDPVSFEMTARAQNLDAAIHVLLFARTGVSDETLAPLFHHGAHEVLLLENDAFTFFQADVWGRLFADVARKENMNVFLAPADTLGRTLLPYAAMLLHTGLTADCTALALDSETGILDQTRPAVGGDIMATIRCEAHRPQMATIRPRSTAVPAPDMSRTGKIRRCRVTLDGKALQTQLVSFTPAPAELSLAAADKVVVVGRGIKRPENLPAIKEFADSIGAALGATREAVDRNWLPYSCQIGLSGRTIAPRLYIGLGVSGAIQHLIGMRTAETIVAVNKDPDAPIFKVADFGIAGDCMELLPHLKSILSGKGGVR